MNQIKVARNTERNVLNESQRVKFAKSQPPILEPSKSNRFWHTSRRSYENEEEEEDVPIIAQ